MTKAAASGMTKPYAIYSQVLVAVTARRTPTLSITARGAESSGNPTASNKPATMSTNTS